MKTSIIGYPRVGFLRELKFTTEKYFRGEISAEELQNTAKEIRKTQWTLQKNTGLDFIPSNDFSFYDMTLDTAVLFNIIPERYTKLGLSALDTYFAMARGYQGAAGDVKALAMKNGSTPTIITWYRKSMIIQRSNLPEPSPLTSLQRQKTLALPQNR